MRTPFLFLLACLISLTALESTAQSRVYDKDILGKWKLVFELDKQGDNAFERIVMKALDGFLDEIDIRFDFHKDHRVLITVRALGDDEETEESEWQINSSGHLMISDTDHFDSDDVWMMKDGKLFAYDIKDGELVVDDEGVHLERVK